MGGTTTSPCWTRGAELSPQPQVSNARGMLHRLVSCGRCRSMRLEVGRGREARQIGLEQIFSPHSCLHAAALAPGPARLAGWLAVGVRDSLSLITIR